MKKQTVYIPVKVEDELPESECFNINFHNQLHCGYVSENKRNGGYKSEDDNTTSNHLIYWLKPQEAFVFTPEQLNELLSNVIKDTLETAYDEAKVVKDLGEDENGKLTFEVTECYYDEHGYPIYVEKESIINTFEQNFKKYKV